MLDRTFLRALVPLYATVLTAACDGGLSRPDDADDHTDAIDDVFDSGDVSDDIDAADTGHPDAEIDAETDADAGSGRPMYRSELLEREDFDALSSVEGELKFLTRAPSGALPGPLSGFDCAFQDSERFAFHIQFLRALEGLGGYSQVDYARDSAQRASRVFAPGSLYALDDATHPDGSAGAIAWTFSVSADQAPQTVEEWAEWDARLGTCVRFAPSDLVLIGVDPAQEQWLLSHRTQLAAVGVTVAGQDELRQGTLQVYSDGETYGYLNVVAPGVAPTEYGPRDILVVDAASDDISVVAGIVTTFAQSFGSHLNLRMREKELPNLRWTGVREDARVTQLSGALVHLAVTPDGAITLEPASLAEAEAFWALQQPPLGAPASDLTRTALADLATLRHADALAYGVKAANLGELQVVLEDANRPSGFAIPFSWYAEHVAFNGLDPVIAGLISDPEVAADRAVRTARLEALQRQIRNAPLAPGVLDALATEIRASFGPAAETTFVRFRSSTNAEDLEAFSGAGLYDSKTGCLADDLDGDSAGPSRCLTEAHRAALIAQRAAWVDELGLHPDRTWLADLIAEIDDDLSDEKPVADALRKVWRSLWNVRAFEERAYWGIDHDAVYMGVAVVPRMVLEQAESVAFTNLESTRAPGGLFRVVTQLGEIGVVRPVIPTASPEILTFVRQGQSGGEFTVLQRSSESPDADAFDSTLRTEIARLLIVVHDHFATQVYPHIDPLRLDVEFDLDSTGVPVFKQARPYLGE